MPNQSDSGNEKIAQATIKIREEELQLLLFLRRARNAAGNATLRVEIELSATELKPTNVTKLNPDPVLALG